MKVWDPLVRVLHWVLVTGVAIGWLSTLGWGTTWHNAAGYVALATVAVRVVWGLAFGGPFTRFARVARFARFRQFLRSPRRTWAYAGDVAAAREPRYLGHNPLGGWMIVLLLGMVTAIGVTGWLYTTDAFWGDETVERWHRGLAWGLLGLIALHLAGVAFTSWRHRENLVAAMLTGEKRPPAAGDIE